MDIQHHKAMREEIVEQTKAWRDQEKELVATLEEAFPSGMELICHHGDQRFLVVSTGEAEIHGLRVLVENPNTGKVTWRYWRNLRPANQEHPND